MYHFTERQFLASTECNMYFALHSSSLARNTWI